jgi:hypothetical protein
MHAVGTQGSAATRVRCCMASRALSRAGAHSLCRCREMQGDRDQIERRAALGEQEIPYDGVDVSFQEVGEEMPRSSACAALGHAASVRACVPYGCGWRERDRNNVES